MKKIKSCIKWTGGKYRELDVIVENLPSNFTTYVEPFVGGGVLFWTLESEYEDKVKYHINDTNEELVNFYQILKKDYTKLINSLSQHQHNKKYFIKVRGDFNSKNLSKLERASIFYYLNKTAFSGKYRVNSKGHYNNSWGGYKNITWDKIHKKYHTSLQKVEITNKCALSILDQYKHNKNAFIFLDPPYYNCDDMYNNPTLKELDELYKGILTNLKTSKAKILMIAGDGKLIRDLFGDFISYEYEFKYTHNASAKKTNNHIIIKNY